MFKGIKDKNRRKWNLAQKINTLYNIGARNRKHGSEEIRTKYGEKKKIIKSHTL